MPGHSKYLLNIGRINKLVSFLFLIDDKLVTWDKKGKWKQGCSLHLSGALWSLLCFYLFHSWLPSFSRELKPTTQHMSIYSSSSRIHHAWTTNFMFTVHILPKGNFIILAMGKDCLSKDWRSLDLITFHWDKRLWSWRWKSIPKTRLWTGRQQKTDYFIFFLAN